MLSINLTYSSKLIFKGNEGKTDEAPSAGSRRTTGDWLSIMIDSLLESEFGEPGSGSVRMALLPNELDRATIQ